MASQRDYYDVLGISRGSSEDEIKGAYRKLALENHPDRNPDNAEAEQRFKEAADAYAVLSDDGKRKAYDQYGHAGVDGMAGGGPGFSNVEDIFSAFGDLFGGGGGIFEQFFGGGQRSSSRRGTSLRIDLELSLEEVATGIKKSLGVTRQMPCDNCGGSGAKPGTQPTQCQTCNGIGEIARSQGFFAIRQPCPTCQSSGKVIESPCSKCRGTGRRPKKDSITITIPAGIEEGHVERIPGQGEAGEASGPPGDLVVVIHVRPDQIFTRHGDDLLAHAAIRFRQAVLGDSIEIPTITGETVVLKIPSATQPGTRLRVRGHGLPRINGYGKGNLIVQIQVEVPAKVAGEQKEALERFDEIEQEKHKKSGRKKSIFEKVRNILK